VVLTIIACKSTFQLQELEDRILDWEKDAIEFKEIKDREPLDNNARAKQILRKMLKEVRERRQQIVNNPPSGY
jgi:hypothetical protein